MVQRTFNLPKTHSFFLFGPRGVGKSTLFDQDFSRIKEDNKLVINLLDDEAFSAYQSRPSRLKEQVDLNFKKLEWVLIDEIQRIPELLNVCHLIMEKHKHIRFGMTGSSARKLKRGQANLLAGRAFTFFLHPLLHSELPASLTTEEYISYGGLPKLLSLDSPQEKKRYLNSYVQTYIKEEIVAEQLVRNLSGFRKFLGVAAQMNTQILNYHNIALDTGLDDKTVARFFEILEDTLVARLLEPYHGSVRKRQKLKPKFYLFDTGVARAMELSLDEPLQSSTTQFGNLFEQMIVNEFYRLKDYHEKSWNFSYLKTQTDLEIDLIIQKSKTQSVLVEIKSSRLIKEDHLNSLRKLGADFPKSLKIVLCQESLGRKTADGIHILPWREGLDFIFNPGGT